MIKKLSGLLDKLISHVLVAVISLVTLLSLLGIILRQFQVTFLWLEPLIRHLIFISSFLAAALAVADDKHIKIEILKNILEKRVKLSKFTSYAVMLSSFFVLGWLTYASWQFYQVEKTYADIGFLGIPTSFWIGSMTAGLGLMLFRLFLNLLKCEKTQ
ncbi:MAG: TRAP transporter small permease subunit [Bacteriovoracaceae bacterium]|nr:TRAP transporter small permease subunit [Bacteriovoracaceae bacterium]